MLHRVGGGQSAAINIKGGLRSSKRPTSYPQEPGLPLPRIGEPSKGSEGNRDVLQPGLGKEHSAGRAEGGERNTSLVL